MRLKTDILLQMTNPGVIPVLRVKQPKQVLPLARALVAGGINVVEISLTTPEAIACIRAATEALGDQALIGVGTVLDDDACRAAITAGAQFIVSPVCRPELVSIGHASQRPVMLGAYTPTEAQRAHEAGADLIKIFPADALGPDYIRSILAPLPHLRIVPMGRVALNNIADYFHAGCVAVGVGSSLLTPDLLQNEDWPALTRRAAEFVSAAQRFGA
jgi:2-dehydro-3-deoxyphosphogluconate aldolase / (4S)-4-hydroxy-2-oxoglutarate aldolase